MAATGLHRISSVPRYSTEAIGVTSAASVGAMALTGLNALEWAISGFLLLIIGALLLVGAHAHRRTV